MSGTHLPTLPLGVRSEFPALVAAPDRAYLDSASTTQLPRPVLDAVTAVLAAPAANPGRGSYPWATAAAARVEAARLRVARFVGAAADDVVLLPSATAASNAVALGWGAATLADGDEVLVGAADHAATVLPWVRLGEVLARAGPRVRLVRYRVTAAGEADVADVRAKVSARTRVLCLTHLHGVFGARSTLEEVRDLLPSRVVTVVDATQSAGRIPVHVDDLGADFLFFSGHKMFGLPGAAALYCRPRTHPEIGPFLPGGAGRTVDRPVDRAVDHPGGSGPADDLGSVVLDTGPRALEAGSPNVPAVVALAAAAEFVDSLGIEAVAAHNARLTGRLVDGLRALPRVRLLPGVAHAACSVGYGLVSFSIDGERSDDVGFALAEHGIDVRTGRHCLAARAGLEESVRVSTHVHTTPDEIDRLVSTLHDLLGET